MSTPDHPQPATPADLTPWDALSPEHQLELRMDYGRYLDTLPPTCSLEEKDRRFARWLKARGVAYG